MGDAYRRHLERAQASESAAQLQEGLEVWFDEALPPPPGRALDVGSGRGQALAYLRRRGFVVSAYEPDPELARGLKASGEQLVERLGEGGFDLVFCKDVLEHVPPDEGVEFVRRLRESVRPGGTVVVSVPHAAAFLGDWLRYGDYTHRTSFTESSLQVVLESGGFEDVRHVLPTFRWSWKPKRLAYRALKSAWHGVWRGLYLLEHPDPNTAPRHVHPRLVATARRPSEA